MTSPQLIDHLERYGVPSHFFAKLQRNNSFVDFSNVGGAIKAPYYPFGAGGQDFEAGRGRREMAEYVGAKFDTELNLYARTMQYRPQTRRVAYHPHLIDWRELARQGAHLNTSAIVQDVGPYSLQARDQWNFVDAHYSSAAQLGQPPTGRQPFL